MNDIYSSDKPIDKNSEDKFQRYQFSKRIAETIINRNNDSSLVIGLYGAWGEGKSSILNFIQQELHNKEDVLILNFNPWRYSDENALLKNFLNKVSKLFNKELNSKKEKFGNIISKYGSIPGLLGYDISKIGEIIADVDLETLKDRVNEFIKEGNNKLVIIIDDIDRLDKDEIFSLFRLVKLTADFNKTTYILAFDEKMVSNAIGERFGDSNSDSGNNFLEKIIQVPIKIPQAQPEALQQFCFDLLNKSIEENKIVLTEQETQNFVGQFTYNVLPKLKTPRLAVRYSNSLSFSMPLLMGEVNIVDLMLIEAIKIFYPKHYDFIKNNSHYFLSSYSSTYSYNRNAIEETKNELIKHLDTLSIDLNKVEKKAILDLLIYLFPRLNEAFNNSFEHEGAKKWIKEKRIGSNNYFKRYFSYAVLNGETSDVEFDSILKIIENENQETVSKILGDFIDNSSANEFLYKIRLYEEDFNWNTSKKIILGLSANANKFNDDFNLFNFGLSSEMNQLAIFVVNLIKAHKNETDSFDFSISLMKLKPYAYAYKINNWLRSGREDSSKIYDANQYTLLARELRLNLLEDCSDIPIYKNQSGNLSYILLTWKEENNEEFEKYFAQYFTDAKNIYEFLVAFTPLAQSTDQPEPYKSNFTQEHYNIIKSLFNVEDFYKNLMENYENEILEEPVQYFDFENNQTEINIIRQFIHWYDLDKKE